MKSKEELFYRITVKLTHTTEDKKGKIKNNPYEFSILVPKGKELTHSATSKWSIEPMSRPYVQYD